MNLDLGLHLRRRSHKSPISNALLSAFHCGAASSVGRVGSALAWLCLPVTLSTSAAQDAHSGRMFELPELMASDI